MAGASLLTLIDDIVSVLDDIAAMTKVAASKTSGVLGDDLALNAEQVSGVRAARELPVVWAVAKGSFKNKLILLPLALILSTFLPWLVLPLLMLGGIYLCFEGAEKILHTDDAEVHEERSTAGSVMQSEIEEHLLSVEKQKIQGAIRTDFVLSAEIMIITLGTVAGSPFITRLSVMSLTAVLMTAGVYGLVAAIIKLDDIGLFFQRRAKSERNLIYQAGSVLVSFAPLLLRFLAIAGTIAMFTVGGGILSHGIPVLHQASEFAEQYVSLQTQAGWIATVTGIFIDAVTGLLAGTVTVISWAGLQRFRRA